MIAGVLLAFAASLPAQDDFARKRALPALEGRPAPALRVHGWRNRERFDLDALDGKVVLLDFWGTWCLPCRKAVPRLKKLQERYADQGLVVIGVHTARGSGRMDAFVDELRIRYPVAVDRGGRTGVAFDVESFPSYYLIDRAGVLRFADLASHDLERALQHLLAEEAPEPDYTRLARAAVGAQPDLDLEVVVAGEVGVVLELDRAVLGEGEYVRIVEQLVERGPQGSRRKGLRSELALDDLSLVAASGGASGDEGFDLWLSGGRLTGRAFGEDVDLAFEGPLVTEPAVLLLAAALQFEEGSERTFTLLELEHGVRIRPGNRVRYEGREVLDLDGTRHPAHRIALFEAGSNAAELVLWFSDDRVLLEGRGDGPGVALRVRREPPR